jgi:transposase
VYTLLEGHFELLVVNAAHVKNVPGRKTDVKDAEWLTDLLQHGLLRASFIPPPPQRELRELTRHRSNFVAERATLTNRVHKVLEGSNLKLTSVLTDVQGVSGKAILQALLEGQTDPTLLADLAKGRLRQKRPDLERALQGRLNAAQHFVLGELLCQLDALDESIERFDQQILAACAPLEQAVAHLDTIPGVARTTAEVIVAEVGTDMSRFPTPAHLAAWAAHLAAWAGVAPGNNESAGKRLSGRVRQGNVSLRKALVQAAWAATRTRQTYLAAQYHRLAGRRGKKRALLAVAHSIIVIAYRLIERDEDYKELGANYFDQRRPESTVRHLTSRLSQLGFDVTLNPKATVEAA